MAAVTGTVQNAWGFGTPAGPKKTSAGAEVGFCLIEVTFAGTYASADDGTLTKSAIATRIATERRDGKTVTVMSLACVAPGDEAGSAVFADKYTLSGSTYTMQLLQADNSTEHADGAMGTWNHGVIFAVGYTAV